MSFQYGQFSTGFDVLQPTHQALNFFDLLEIRGEDVTIVYQALTGYDAYGNPTYTESKTTEKAIVKVLPQEHYIPPGELKTHRAKVLFKQWANVAEDNYELEINGERYHVELVHRTEACIEVTARRKID